MLVSAHQPAYLPWLGYIEKIVKSDVFIYLDTVQFEKNSFTNRNKIKTANGAVMLTIPVKTKNHTSVQMSQIAIDNSQPWQKKHLNTIFLSYKKAPYFNKIMPLIEEFYTKKYDYLSTYCFDYLKVWLDLFDIKPPIVKSSTLNLKSSKSDLVLELCKSQGADKYLSGIMGKDYLEVEKFKKEGIEVEFQNYHPKEYPQLWKGEFIPALGIIDYAMNNKELVL